MKCPHLTTLLLIILLLPACTLSRPIRYKIQSNYSVADPQFPQTTGNLLGPPIISGNAITTLRNGDEIFPAMLAAIHSAKQSITFETYIFWSGDIARQFTNAFCERAKAGVPVYVLIDWYGGNKISNAYLAQMKAAGVHFHQYHPFHIYDPFTWALLDHRTHRKVMVIDGAIGFTGGVGIADEWLGHADSPHHWRDNHYRIQGPAVAQLQAAFVDNWMQTTGEVLDGQNYFPQLKPAGPHYAQVFKSDSTGGSENMQLLFLLSIAAAKNTIRIESAYFVPDELTMHALIAAAHRGVHIQIIVPGKHIDQGWVRTASRHHWGNMLKAGIEIYEYKHTMLHCKLLIVDHLWTSIGSANLDNRSFRLNDEANLNVLDRDFAAQQIAIFNGDLQHSKKITYEAWKHRPLTERITGFFDSFVGDEL